MTKHLAAVALALALSACGFHARTHLVLPEKLGPTTVVSTDPYSPLAEELANALDRAGVPAATKDNRGTVEVAVDAAREDIEKLAMAEPHVAKFLEGQSVKKV
ncbi:MAG TPA: hypothetical protein VL172_15340, partial [Kofleriaceae bacterium]|nr:hypothetical protein [Kofleriaceae bacterium]